MNTIQITVATSISADVKKVWDYYTIPGHITKWNFASDDWHCPNVTNDLRAGGKYSARMEAKDGSFGFDFNAVYDEVIPQQKIVYTMEDGRKASIAFESVGKATTITVVFDAEKINPPEMQQGGWQAILNNFKKYTEQ